MSVAGEIILDGVLLGGLYGLLAAGLSLIFGVMRLVNVAHGDFIVLAAFLALVLQSAFGMHSPFGALAVLVPSMFVIGYGLQRAIFNPVMGTEMLRPVLVSFGLSIILQNLLFVAFSADPQRLNAGGFGNLSFDLPGGVTAGALPMATLAACVGVIGVLQWLIWHTALGRALRAVSDDADTAELIGLDTRHLFAVATGLALGAVAIAGVFVGLRSSFAPASGPDMLIFAFEAVIIGGLGSLWGTLLGGVLLGIAQATGARLSPDWQILAGHLVFLAVLAVRPQGLLAGRER